MAPTTLQEEGASSGKGRRRGVKQRRWSRMAGVSGMVPGVKEIGGRCLARGGRLVCLVTLTRTYWRRFLPRFRGKFGCNR